MTKKDELFNEGAGDGEDPAKSGRPFNEQVAMHLTIASFPSIDHLDHQKHFLRSGANALDQAGEMDRGL